MTRVLFEARGHPNILASHRNTLELTKDDWLSKRGDCIIGISLKIDFKELKRLLRKSERFKLVMLVGGMRDCIYAQSNKDYSHERDIVLRKGTFLSSRTAGIVANKAACDIKEGIIHKLQRGACLKGWFEPHKISFLIFDFDDTLEHFKPAKSAAERAIAKELTKYAKIDEQRIMQELDELDFLFTRKASATGNYRLYDRSFWFRELEKRLKIKLDIGRLVKIYWDEVLRNARLAPNCKSVLRRLAKRYHLILMSDSDGLREIKERRISKLGIEKYFDLIVLGDDVSATKPDKRFYDAVAKKLGIRLNEGVMIGDKPQIDLRLAKQLGMMTVWLRYGRWSERLGDVRYDYVDWTLKDLKGLLRILA